MSYPEGFQTWSLEMKNGYYAAKAEEYAEDKRREAEFAPTPSRNAPAVDFRRDLTQDFRRELTRV